MAIQYGGNEIRIDSSDLQLLHRNTLIAVKVRVIDDTPFVLGCVKVPSGAWEAQAILCNQELMGVTPESEIARLGSAKEWVRQIVLPRLQEWLNSLFPAEAGNGNGTPQTALEQIAAAVSPTGISLRVQADGTVKAELS